MIKKFIGLVGIVILISSLFITKIIKNGETKAKLLDDQKTSYGYIASDIPPCTWEVQEPEKVVSENKTQAVIVNVSSSKDSECESTLSLRAPGFILSPSKEEQTINLAKGTKGSISWILSPLKTGTYDLAVSDSLTTKVYGVTVTNIFGLSAAQAKSASFVGTIFGPMLTVPWWWDRFRKKKEAPEENKHSHESSKT